MLEAIHGDYGPLGGGAAVKTKQAWTEVTRFDAVGVPGVNFGPGNSAESHQKNESTSLRLMVECYAMFERFLTRAPEGA